MTGLKKQLLSGMFFSFNNQLNSSLELMHTALNSYNGTPFGSSGKL